MGRDCKVKRTDATPSPGRLSCPSALSVQNLQAERPRAEGRLLAAACRQQELLQEQAAAGRRLVQGLTLRGKLFAARQRELGSLRAELGAQLEALGLQLRALELSCEAARAERDAVAAQGAGGESAGAPEEDDDDGLGLLSLIDCGEAELLEMECDVLRHQERHVTLQLARARSAADTARLERRRLRMLLQRAYAELAALQDTAAEVEGEIGRLRAGSPPPAPAGEPPLPPAWAPGAVSLRRSSCPSRLARAALASAPPLLGSGAELGDAAYAPVPLEECECPAVPAPCAEGREPPLALSDDRGGAAGHGDAPPCRAAEAEAEEALLLAAVDAVLAACVADALDSAACRWSFCAATGVEQEGDGHEPKPPLELGTGQDHVLSRGRQGGAGANLAKAGSQQLWDAVPAPTRKRKGSGGGLVEALGIALSLLPWRARSGDDWWVAAEKGTHEGPPPPSPRSGELSPSCSPNMQRRASESERWLQELYSSGGGDGGKEGAGPLIHV